MDGDSDVDFLEEAARYFERRHTGGEDAAYWANVFNARSCRRIAERLKSTPSGMAALQAIADLPRPESEARCAGQEDAYRAVEGLFKEPPRITVSEIKPTN